MLPITLVFTAVVVLVLQRLLAKFPPSSWAFCFPLYLKLSRNTTFAELLVKKHERSQVYAEKSKLSPQDQYAKWTKLNRKHDTLSKEISTLEEQLLAEKKTLDSLLSGLVTLVTVVSYALRFWYRSTPLFYLPRDSLPYLVERLLAFPSVPLGAVGYGQWCTLLGVFVTGIVFIVTTLTKKVEEPKPEEIPVAN